MHYSGWVQKFSLEHKPCTLLQKSLLKRLKILKCISRAAYGLASTIHPILYNSAQNQILLLKKMLEQRGTYPFGSLLPLWKL